MTIKPHEAAAFWSADSIAECLNVSRDTYSELWNKCVPLYDGADRGECPGEVTFELTKYGWKLLSDEAKLDVNRALAANEAEWS
jgi:hypothetical protein